MVPPDHGMGVPSIHHLHRSLACAQLDWQSTRLQDEHMTYNRPLHLPGPNTPTIIDLHFTADGKGNEWNGQPHKRILHHVFQQLRATPG